MSQTSIAKWSEALRLPGETDLIHSSLRELVEYFGISEAEARRAGETAVADSKREWERAPRETPKQVLDFYDRTRSYIFEHVWWHAMDLEINAINVEFLDYALRQGVRDYLDFGSGVGANAILFARSGLQVTLADVSHTMLDFARWRMERRGLKAEYVYLRERDLPRRGFDLVTVVDVFEHLVDPRAEVRRIGAALKPGGAMIFNCRAGYDPERPMHILSTMYPIFRELRHSGFRAAGPAADPIRALGGYYAFIQGEQGRISNLGWGLYDHLRYGPVAELSKSALDRMRARRVEAG